MTYIEKTSYSEVASFPLTVLYPLQTFLESSMNGVKQQIIDRPEAPQYLIICV